MKDLHPPLCFTWQKREHHPININF